MKEKSIYCPLCKGFLTKVKVEDKIHKLQCRGCWRWIWFNPDTDEFQIKRTPPRQSSSGMRFY